MDFFQQKLRDFAQIFLHQKKEEKKTREISKYQGYIKLIHKILTWQDTTSTLTVFLLLNFLFLLIVQFEIKPLGVIFLLCTIFFIGDNCFEINHYYHLTNEETQTIESFFNDLSEIITYLKKLRRETPSVFCAGLSLFFLVLSFIGRNLSGPMFIYLTFLCLFFIPLTLMSLPPQYQGTIKKIIGSIQSDTGVLAEEELIPYISDSFGERDPELESLLTDRTADSIPNSFISGISSMPSYLDAEENELQEEDFLPSNQATNLNQEMSSDSDSENKDMKFDPAYFNSDSSEDENLIKPNDKQIIGLVSNLLNVGNIIKNAVTNSSIKNIEQNSSSSESEFEIINPEEMDEH